MFWIIHPRDEWYVMVGLTRAGSPAALIPAPTLCCFTLWSLLLTGLFLSCFPPACWLLTSHQWSNVTKLLRTELKTGVQIPSGGKTQWTVRGWQQLCREHQCLPVAGKGTQSGPCSAQPLASWGETCWRGWWGSWWRRERKDRKLLQGKNGKQKEGIAGGRLPKVAESRLVQLTMPYSVQTVPEQHPCI